MLEPAPPKTGELVTLSLKPQSGEEIQGLCRRLADQLSEHSATPLHLLVFGKCSASTTTLDALQNKIGHADWPVTWVEGSACDGSPVAGIQVQAFSGTVERISFGGRVVGSVFTEGGARQCLVGSLAGNDQTLTRSEQTRRTFEELQTILVKAGFDLSDLVRTWFFLENILSWYDEFNHERTAIYSGLKFRSGSLPASTGVAAKNPANTALALAAWAFRPLSKNVRAKEVASPLQCPAPNYGSSFSRAMEIPTSTGRRLLISGTASIAPGGKTVWAGDVRKQVDLTMDVVGAILNTRGFTFADLTRATAYFRNPTDAGAFAEWLTTNQLLAMPVTSVQCDVCRNDLIFELEADAETSAPLP